MSETDVEVLLLDNNIRLTCIAFYTRMHLRYSGIAELRE
jgi:hypothetical protein